MSDPRRPVFEAIKTARGGKGFDHLEVGAIDNVLDALGVPRASDARKIGPEGIALIKEFEGCHKVLPNGSVRAYRDPGTGHLPITIGWGSTKGKDGKPIPEGTVMSQAEVDALFERDLAKNAAEVAKAVGKAPTSQRQLDALVSFHYNTGAIATATLTKKHRAGDFEGAAKEFARWNKSGGKVMKGLTRRRAAEAQLYRAGS